jgi:hypothetical protein
LRRRTRVKRFLVSFGIAAAYTLGCFLALSQAPATPPKLEPTETQKLKLENAQLRAQVARDRADQAANAYNATIAAFFEMCNQVKKENGWDAGVTCNISTLAFSPPKPTPSPAPTPTDPGKSQSKSPPGK